MSTEISQGKGCEKGTSGGQDLKTIRNNKKVKNEKWSKRILLEEESSRTERDQ